MQITINTEISIARPREQVFKYLTDGDTYIKVLLPLFPLPGVQSVTLKDADKPAKGVLRHIGLSDGSTVDEMIDEHDVPNVHCYSWGDELQLPLSLITRGAAARWDFEETESGTHVRWGYVFTLTSPIAYPVAKVFSLRFRAWMRAGLERARTELESHTVAAGNQS